MKSELYNRGKEEWKCKKLNSINITRRGTSKGRQDRENRKGHAGLAIRNPPKKNHKKPSKKTTKNGFFGFFKFLIFYENNTNFSL
jgi:hypothetical protein